MESIPPALCILAVYDKYKNSEVYAYSNLSKRIQTIFPKFEKFNICKIVSYNFFSSFLAYHRGAPVISWLYYTLFIENWILEYPAYRLFQASR